MSSSNRTDNANNNYNKDLVEAIRNQQYDEVNNILEHHRDNIDINGDIDDDSKYTPLREACSTQHDARIVALLLEYGADPNHGNELVEMNGERYYSNANSPIWGPIIPHRQLQIVQKDILSHLLRYGADPNVIDPEIGWSPLHSACFFARYDEMELLLRHGANVNQLDRYGSSPMFDLLNLYERHRLQQHRLQHDGDMPDMTYDSLDNNHLSCLRLLLEYGADPNISSGWSGMTPLFHAIHESWGECELNFIRLLMQHGADVTIPLSMTPPWHIRCANCIKGDTVLHAAVRHADVDAICLMTESRAITSFWWLRNDAGDTVYDLAAKSKDTTPIIEYFDMKWQQLRQQCYAYLRYDWIHKKPCSHS